MALITRDHTYIDGKPAKASDVNENEIKLFNEINGNLDWENLKAALVNAANGILKLDGNARVLLAQIPDTLTGKDADTVDGVDIPATIAEVLSDHDKAAHDALGVDADTLDTTHYSDVVTQIAADIATHKADASAHHTKAGSSEIDHGSITGLADDDHSQYYNATRHTKAIHDALNIDADKLDGKHVNQLLQLYTGQTDKIFNEQATAGYFRLGKVQVCWATKSVSVNADFKGSVVWTFPAEFLGGSVPIVNATTNSDGIEPFEYIATTDQPTEASCVITIIERDHTVRTQTYKVGCLAIGRWQS